MENQPANQFQVPVQPQTYVASNPNSTQASSGGPKPKINPKLILLGFFVFLLIALPVVAFFLGQQQGQAIKTAKLAESMNSINITPLPPTSTPTPTLIPTPTILVSTDSGTLIATETANWKTYINSKYKFSIKYPSDWVTQEYPDATGSNFAISAANLQSPAINVRTIAKASNHVNDPFANYVQIAAIQELQGYTKLVSNKPITATSGITGYETTWTVSSSGQTSDSLPITYFEIANNQAATIQVFLNKKEDLSIYEQMLSTFKFTQ